MPELGDIVHYLGLRKVGCAGWPKQAFWFGYSRRGEEMQRSDQLMLITPGLPIGPDVHILRSDTDAFLVSRFPHYGVEYRDRTSVDEALIGNDGVSLRLNGPAGPQEVHGRYLLDCTGYGSKMSRQLELRDRSPTCRTNTRTIFSHFRDVPLLEDVLGYTDSMLVNSRDAATIHHCFDGGWVWIIRFDNGIVSVGLTLDRNRHPNDDWPAEEEFWDLIGRYPTIRAQLDGATAIRPFVKTGRLQYTSKACIRDRFALAPHAAAFLDPLVSTGMNLSQAFISRFVPRSRREPVRISTSMSTSSAPTSSMREITQNNARQDG